MSRLAARQELWRVGNLKWKLHKHQKKMYELINSADASDYFVLLCSRRTGKTFTLLIIAFEECLKNPNHIVNLVSTTIKEVKRAIYPNIQEILKDCPADIKPKFNSQDSVFIFPNGSRLIIAGANMGHVEQLRGGTSHLNLIDEAGQVDNLKYLMGSVMNPMTATTNGRTVLASTPAPSSGHDFFSISEIARLRDTFIRFTIEDSGHLTLDAINKIHKECMETDSVETIDESDTFLREYMCQWITASNKKIIKAWKGKWMRVATADYDDDKYQFWHKYTSMDLGFSLDFTSIIWAHYNFDEARLYVEAEYTNKGVATITSKLQQVIKDEEKSRWGDLQPYKRIADSNEPRMLADMGNDYNLWFIATHKESLQAMVNKVQVWVENGRIAVAPECKQVLGCLEFGIWDSRFKGFDRTEAYGHFDALASLIYLVRNIDENTNPVPSLYNLDPSRMHIPPELLNHDVSPETARMFKDMFPLALKRRR